MKSLLYGCLLTHVWSSAFRRLDAWLSSKDVLESHASLTPSPPRSGGEGRGEVGAFFLKTLYFFLLEGKAHLFFSAVC